MSVLIKGLHKPDENHGCPFVDVEYGYCLVDLGVTGNGEKCERMKECPLIELPDHGDLIDRNRMVEVLHNGSKNVFGIQEGTKDEKSTSYLQGVMVGYANSMVALDAAPAVIPAERREE